MATTKCSAVTPFKQKDFQHLCKTCITKTIAVYKKYHDKSWFDANGLYFIDGSAGTMDAATLTSPQIFLESLLPFKNSPIPIKVYLIEYEYKNYNIVLKDVDNKICSDDICDIITNAGCSLIDYHKTNTNVTYWDGSAPVSLQEAIDRIAAVVSSNHGSIP